MQNVLPSFRSPGRPLVQPLERRVMLATTPISDEEIWYTGGPTSGSPPVAHADWTPAPSSPDANWQGSYGQDYGTTVTLAPNLGAIVPPYTHVEAAWSHLPHETPPPIGHLRFSQLGDNGPNLSGNYGTEIHLGDVLLHSSSYTLTEIPDTSIHHRTFEVTSRSVVRMAEFTYGTRGWHWDGSDYEWVDTVVTLPRGMAGNSFDISVRSYQPAAITPPGTRYTLHHLGVSVLTPEVSVSAHDSYALEEGDDDVIEFRFSRSGTPISQPLTVNFGLSGDATPNWDYYVEGADTSPGGGGADAMSFGGGVGGSGGGVGQPGGGVDHYGRGKVTIPAGSSFADITVVPIDDVEIEPTEDVIAMVEPGANYFAPATAPAPRTAGLGTHDALIVLVSGHTQNGGNDNDPNTSASQPSADAGIRGLQPSLTAAGLGEVRMYSEDPGNHGDEAPLNTAFCGNNGPQEDHIISEILAVALRRNLRQEPLRLVMIGYSHGGGLVHDISARLRTEAHGGDNANVTFAYSLIFTAYIDALRQPKMFPLSPFAGEARRPELSAHHVNFYQSKGGPDYHGVATDVLNPGYQEDMDAGAANASVIKHSEIDDSPYVHAQLLNRLKQVAGV